MRFRMLPRSGNAVRIFDGEPDRLAIIGKYLRREGKAIDIVSASFAAAVARQKGGIDS